VVPLSAIGALKVGLLPRVDVFVVVVAVVSRIPSGASAVARVCVLIAIPVLFA
jgi:hypothetical protein